MMSEQISFQPVDEMLYDPLLKLRLLFGGSSGLAPNEAYFVIEYDPEIRVDRLMVPRSDEDREQCLSIPALAHLADQPIPFVSAQSRTLVRIGCQWAETDHATYIKITDDAYAFKLHLELVGNELPHEFPLSSRELILICLKEAPRLLRLRAEKLGKPDMPNQGSPQLYFRDDVVHLLEIPTQEMGDAGDGWRRVSSEEIK